MWDVLELKSLGEESDLGREMWVMMMMRMREDVEALAVVNGLFGDDAVESSSVMGEGVV